MQKSSGLADNSFILCRYVCYPSIILCCIVAGSGPEGFSVPSRPHLTVYAVGGRTLAGGEKPERRRQRYLRIIRDVLGRSEGDFWGFPTEVMVLLLHWSLKQ